jgi:hypothetical protein
VTKRARVMAATANGDEGSGDGNNGGGRASVTKVVSERPQQC